MQFYSTNNKSNLVPLQKAVIDGIAEDGGLYMPDLSIKLPASFLEVLPNLTLNEIALTVAQKICEDISANDLSNIIENTLSFGFPLVQIQKNISVLELFHGPTLAFKDLGARFLANLLSLYLKNRNKQIIVLVATSGDTGSAVAHAFYGKQGFKVCLLYPSGKVSSIQEQQLTTIGNNVTALEIQGSFDDCQSLVKKAFTDPDLKAKYDLTSANSINVARLLPQSFYYFHACGQLRNRAESAVFVVPCGNFGNLTAGLIASKLGLHVNFFIAAVNANIFFPHYLATAEIGARPAVKTISNAMDVGNPSNFKRILDLYDEDVTKVREKIHSISVSDEKTIEGIQEIYNTTNYIMDPHGAVGYMGLKEYLNTHTKKENQAAKSNHYVLLETAHPAKFFDIMARALEFELELPQGLASALHKNKQATLLPNSFNAFKSFLLSAS